MSAALQTLEAPGPECGPVVGLPRELFANLASLFPTDEDRSLELVPDAPRHPELIAARPLQ